MSRPEADVNITNIYLYTNKYFEMIDACVQGDFNKAKNIAESLTQEQFKELKIIANKEKIEDKILFILDIVEEEKKCFRKVNSTENSK